MIPVLLQHMMQYNIEECAALCQEKFSGIEGNALRYYAYKLTAIAALNGQTYIQLLCGQLNSHFLFYYR
jgi:hypothetical protein